MNIYHFISAPVWIFVGFIWAKIDTNLSHPMSEVVSIIVKEIEQPEDAFVCYLDQFGSVRRSLENIGIQDDHFDDIRTVDDENMIVVFDGHRLIGARFTTFKYTLPTTGCFRLRK